MKVIAAYHRVLLFVMGKSGLKLKAARVSLYEKTGTALIVSCCLRDSNSYLQHGNSKKFYGFHDIL